MVFEFRRFMGAGGKKIPTLHEVRDAGMKRGDRAEDAWMVRRFPVRCTNSKK